MDEVDPLSYLNTLDASLKQGLAQMPTLLSTLDQRYRDAMPGPLGTVPLDQLYLDQAPLTHRICSLALGEPLPDEPVLRITADGFEPVTEQENQWARRFLLQAGNDLLQLHLDALKRFWAFTTLNQQPARQWLKQLCTEHMLAQARLRYTDGTLPEASWLLVNQLTGISSSDDGPWQGTVMLHSEGTRWVLPGAFVFCDKDPHQAPSVPVLLSTLTQGLETFDSLSALYQELAERLEDDRQGAALLAPLDPQRQEASLRCDALTFEQVPGKLFDFLQTSLERRQQAAVAQAWEHAKTHFDLRDLDAASDTLDSAAALYSLVSSDGPRLTRYVRLLERDMPAWMVNLSQAQRLELIVAMRDLGLATASAIAPGLPLPRQFADLTWLRQYVHEELTRLLRDQGIRLSPAHIFVTVTSALSSGPIVNPLNPSSSVAARVPAHTSPTIELNTRTRTLVQLAIENISPLDWDYLLTAKVRDLNGNPISGFGASKVRKLIRGANVGGSYGRYLLRRLRHGPEAEWRREHHAKVLSAKLRVETLKARHRGQLGPGDDGWHWIEHVLAQPRQVRRALFNGKPVGVWQLLIRNTPLDGVYLFGPNASSDTQPVLLYTPESPSRQSWRWFSSRQAMTAEWLNRAAFKDYILQRVALAEREPIGKLLGTPSLASFVQARLITHDFFANAYRSETRLVMANADAMSASNRELNLQAIAELAVTLTEIICMVLPGRIGGVLSLSRAIWSFLQAWNAIGEEPANVVLLYAFDGYANLYEAAVSLSTSPLFGTLARRIPLGTPVPLHTHYALKQERNYLRYRLTTEYAEGVYEGRKTNADSSAYFITDRDGRQYEVLNDGEHWRVVDARMPQAMYKPIVRRNQDGDWETVDEIRWRGIVPDIPALLERVRLADPPEGITPGLPTQIDGQFYLRIGQSVLKVRPSLLPGRYTVVIPPLQRPELPLTVLLRFMPQGSWQAKARQGVMSSEWFAL